MKIFKKNQEALTQENADLTAEVAQLKTDLAEAQALAVDPSEELATLTNENASLQTQVETLTNENASLTEQLETLETETAAKVADFEGKVSKQVAKQVADNGLDEGLEGDGDEQETESEIWSKMPEGEEKNAYFAANRKAILGQTILKK